MLGNGVIGYPIRIASGGHRLYSERDIDILKWLLARQDERTEVSSRAVALGAAHHRRGENPLETMRIDSAKSDPLPIIVGETLNQLRDAWIDACLGV